MEFITNIEKKEYETFVENHKHSHFLHSYAWGEVSKTRGLTPHYIGVKENNKLIAATLLLQKQLPSGYSYFYIPRGYCLDYNNKDLLKFLTENIKDYTKKYKSIFFEIDPDIKLHTIDKNGNKIDGENNYKLVEDLKKIGYHHKKLTYFFESNQPRFTFRVDTTKEKEEIQSRYSKSVKRWIKVANKYGVETYIGTKDNVKDFVRLMKQTEKRQKFFSHDYNFYPKFYDIMEKYDYINIFLAKVNLNNIIKVLNEELEKDESRKEKLTKLIEHYTTLKTNGNEQIVSSYITINYGNKSWYLYGANDMDFKDTYANFKLFDHQIIHTHEIGKDLLDEFGTVGKPNSKKSGASLHEFKQKFGGEYIEFIGEFDYITNKFMYLTLFKMIIPLYRKIRKGINHIKVKHNKNKEN